MINSNENTVVVIGPPCAGKTTITDKLAKDYPDYKIYHTDDYISHGFEQSIYSLLNDVRAQGHKKVIIEGIQSARILRKGLERNELFADLIITVSADEDTLAQRYEQRNPGKIYPHSTAKAIDTVFKDYLSKVKRSPRILPVLTK